MTRSRWIAALAVGALALAVGAAAGQLLLSPSLTSAPGRPPAAGPAPAKPGPSPPPPGFVEFRDELFSIAYPTSWQRRRTEDPEVQILADQGDAAAASFLVRVAVLESPVGPQNLDAAKKLTDKVVKSGRKVKLLAPAQRSDLGGLPGWFYLYTFEDGRGRKGTHSQYFLFRGDTMYTMVFQALPADGVSTYAPVFDRIASTFRPSS